MPGRSEGGHVAGRNRSELSGAGAPVELARKLRALRDDCGLTLRQLSVKSGYSISALSQAENGRAAPSWDLTAAFVQTCGQDAGQWRRAWEIARSSGLETAAAVEPFAEAQGPLPRPREIKRAQSGGDLPDLIGAPERSWLYRGPPRLLLIPGLVAGLAIFALGVAFAWMALGGQRPTAAANSALPSQAAQGSLNSQSPVPARDGTDPYDDRCKADEKQLDWQEVYRPEGGSFGTLMLMYSQVCQAAWGYLNGPNTTAWTSHIVAHRIPGDAKAPSEFNGDAAYGSWGNVLSTQNGCVYIEAYISNGHGEGPHARTACFQLPAPQSQSSTTSSYSG